ncbi:heme biosynthesis HemY N-terminal domain-containing protein [Rhodoferax sp.]|uniref:heme biosynthesis HemY N-terminal domain-containing protein n=1 Tax=Rhodoferax sp. TaxID=50421 RepID=UPI0025ED87E5|nr:heme biosynthesis HemY N-terminal domain-containing protein [Rhodoferax sp.]
MRFALWLMALFGMAVVAALFAGSNQGTVTVYWPPYRIDLSLNLVLLGVALAFVTLHLALRALSGLFNIPQQARRWRLSYKERTIYSGLLDSISHLVAGRFVRARKSAEVVVAVEDAMLAGGDALPDATRLRTLAHLLAAESAHALQDRTVRETHFQRALDEAGSKEASDLRDGVQLRAARWALEDRDAAGAVQWLEQLPVGTARRTIALRLRFKAARQARNSRVALDAARVLTKHRAFSEVAGAGIVRGLALELLRSAHDAAQVEQAWSALDPAERVLPDVALEAAERWLRLQGDVSVARLWVLPLWEAQGSGLSYDQRVRLTSVLEMSFGSSDALPDAVWLSRIETAQMALPGDPLLQYLAGVMCVRLSLWGKAQALLKQAIPMLKDAGLKRRAWLALADLAENRLDSKAAAEAYRSAARA